MTTATEFQYKPRVKKLINATIFIVCLLVLVDACYPLYKNKEYKKNKFNILLRQHDLYSFHFIFTESFREDTGEAKSSTVNCTKEESFRVNKRQHTSARSIRSTGKFYYFCLANPLQYIMLLSESHLIAFFNF